MLARPDLSLIDARVLADACIKTIRFKVEDANATKHGGNRHTSSRARRTTPAFALARATAGSERLEHEIFCFDQRPALPKSREHLRRLLSGE